MQLNWIRQPRFWSPLFSASTRCVLRLFAAILVACALFAGCNDDDVVGTDCCCPDTAIGDHLTRVFYWGDGGPLDLIPNSGEPAGDARQPLWIDDRTILTLSETLKSGQLIQGIFAISVDPVTLAFDSVQLFQFPNLRWAYDYDPASAKIALTYSSTPTSFQIALCHLAGQDVVIEETLVESAWQPSGVRFWPGYGGVVFYGTDPSTLTHGFYVHDATGDSLLLNVDLNFEEARSFGPSPDGSRVYYGSSGGSLLGPSRVYSAAFDGSAVEVVHEGRGVFVALDVNPIDGRLIIERYFFGDATIPPGSEFALVNPEDESVVPLDVRTYESSCLFVLAHDPSWSPDGARFAFSGGATSAEGGTRPLAIWAYAVTE